jgi:hypothetical protein
VPRRGPISRGQLCPEPCGGGQETLPNGGGGEETLPNGGGGQETLPNGWTLRLEYMHNLAQTNAVRLNDHLLGYLPARDNAPTWVSVAFPVPTRLLRPGYNELTVEVSRLAPDYQQSDFTWGDVQFRRIRLERH